MPTVRLVKCPQTFNDELGRPMIVTTHRNTSRKYPSHGAKRSARPNKDDAPVEAKPIIFGNAPDETGV